MQKPFDQQPALPETVEQARRARADFMNYVRRAAAAERELAQLKKSARAVCAAIFELPSNPARLILTIRELAGLINFDPRKEN